MWSSVALYPPLLLCQSRDVRHVGMLTQHRLFQLRHLCLHCALSGLNGSRNRKSLQPHLTHSVEPTTPLQVRIENIFFLVVACVSRIPLSSTSFPSLSSLSFAVTRIRSATLMAIAGAIHYSSCLSLLVFLSLPSLHLSPVPCCSSPRSS